MSKVVRTMVMMVTPTETADLSWWDLTDFGLTADKPA